MPSVNPEILSWARTSAGLSRADAARKLGISRAHGQDPERRLAELESGVRAPTRPILVKMAKHYRRPLVTFYLEQPPAPVARRTGYRTLPSRERRPMDALVDALEREMLARQGLVHDVLAEEQAPDVPFLGTLSMEQGVPFAVGTVRGLLGEHDPRQANDPGDLFRRLRADVERLGAFVLLKGDLGSHHTTLDADVFRGLSLTDPLAPFVVINDNDARAAWSFTLLHELVHLLLGSSFCSGTQDDSDVERFCDDVASLFLLPPEPIERFRANAGTLERAVSELSDEWCVSRAMVAYRLMRAGKIGRLDYRRLVEDFRQSWRRERERTRAISRESKGGPSYYTVKRHRTGKALLDLVRRAHFERSLPTTGAATVLGVKPTQVQPLLGGCPARC